MEKLEQGLLKSSNNGKSSDGGSNKTLTVKKSTPNSDSSV